MSDLWEHSDRSVCTHPGWVALRGWAAIVSSFIALFSNGQSLQFLLTDVTTTINGDTGWVTVDENLLGDQGGATVAAINLFARAADGSWRLVLHHGSAVHAARP
jgi:ketosteroid isomerase-like protein